IFILVLSISCNLKTSPAVTIDSKYIGNWTVEGDGEITNFSVSSSGYPSIKGHKDGAEISMSVWGENALTKNSDTSYSFDKYTVNFESDTKGTLSYDGNTYNMTKN
ncbi:hypothetical protein, partial [Brachyspira catarrhinii]|uniref:hypothetical protein n=1 Tax=Brachyspira catarrhinii TaxID=2528966 RepID=UPI001386A7CE